MIYRYHHTHGNGLLGVAHDIGTGPGNVAAELSTRFKHVTATDPSIAHIDAARRLASPLAPNIKFHVCSGEDSISSGVAQKGAADMVTVAECIPLMDSKRAIEVFHEMLHPGGTLVSQDSSTIDSALCKLTRGCQSATCRHNH